MKVCWLRVHVCMCEFHLIFKRATRKIPVCAYWLPLLGTRRGQRERELRQNKSNRTPAARDPPTQSRTRTLWPRRTMTSFEGARCKLIRFLVHQTPRCNANPLVRDLSNRDCGYYLVAFIFQCLYPVCDDSGKRLGHLSACSCVVFLLLQLLLQHGLYQLPHWFHFKLSVRLHLERVFKRRSWATRCRCGSWCITVSNLRGGLDHFLRQ